MAIDNHHLSNLMTHNNYREALALLLPEQLNAKRDRFVLLTRAQLHFYFRNLQASIQDCIKLETYRDTRFDALLQKTEAYLLLLDYSSAKKTLQALHTAKYKSPQLRLLTVRFEYETGNYPKVIKRYNELTEKHRNAEIFNYFVNALIASAQYTTAGEQIGQSSYIKNSLPLKNVFDSLNTAKRDSLLYESTPYSGSRNMKLGVITPLGPGHEECLKVCAESLDLAQKNPSGHRFIDIKHYVVDDTKGSLGRSKARNQGILRAAGDNADWIFFLDADDKMAKDALHVVSPYLDMYDFIWGGIYSGPAQGPFHYRTNQIPFIQTLEQYTTSDPFLTLQMGHFARLNTIQSKTLSFDETMDCGEDIKFYLHELTAGRFLKIPNAFFYNVRGLHSSGPRSASGGDWNRETKKIIDAFNAQRNTARTD